MELTVSSFDSDSTLRVAANMIAALIEARKADDVALKANYGEREVSKAAALEAPPAAVAAEVPPPPPPVESVAANTAPAAGVELDSAGQPWNELLHSSSREKIKDGTWRKRRNSGNGAASDDVLPLVTPPAVAAVAPPPPPPLPAVETASAAKVYPTSVPTLMPLVTAATTSGRVTMVQIAEACQSLGIPNGLGGFATNPELIPFFCDTLGLV